MCAMAYHLNKYVNKCKRASYEHSHETQSSYEYTVNFSKEKIEWLGHVTDLFNFLRGGQTFTNWMYPFTFLVKA